MFATDDDIIRCKRLLQSVLREKEVSSPPDDKINEMVRNIMALTYAKGGDYTEGGLEAYIRIYLRDYPLT
jgi:hypothetical protein